MNRKLLLCRTAETIALCAIALLPASAWQAQTPRPDSTLPNSAPPVSIPPVSGPMILAPEGAPPEAADAVPETLKLEHTPEDFASLGLATSRLQPLDPIPGGHEQNPDFARDLVRLQWRAGDPIDVYVVLPAAVKHPPVALYLLGYPNGSERFRNSQFCRRLTERGVAAVGFSTAITAERYAHRPMKQWFVSELDESMAASTHDVQLVLDYLGSRGDLDTSRVGIFGQGSGAAIAILAASADARIQAIDLLEPWGDWPNFLAASPIVPEDERPDYLMPEFLKRVEPVEPVRYLPQLRDKSIRIQFVDQTPEAKWNKELEQAAPAGAEIHHYVSTEQLRADTGGKLFEWLPGKLLPAGKASVAPDSGPAAAPSSPAVEKTPTVEKKGANH